MNRIKRLGLLGLVLVVGAATRAEEGARVRLTAVHSLQRVGLDQVPEGGDHAVIRAARNEWESFQVVVTAGAESITVTKAELAELVGPAGATITGKNIVLHREEYVVVRRSTRRADLPPGLYPDPLVPFTNPLTGKPIEPRRRSQPRWGGPVTVSGHDMHALPCDVFRGHNQPVWVDVYVPKQTPAGTYKGTFRVWTRNGATAEVPVMLEVWDFTLPDGPTHKNHFGNFRNIAKYFDVERGSEQFKRIEARYCRALVEHRLTPPIPHHLLPEVTGEGTLKITPERHAELRDFIREFHVTDFEIPKSPFARLPTSATAPDYKNLSPSDRDKTLRYYREYYDYLTENSWADGAFVYLWDEPNLSENYEQVLVLGELVHEAVPELKCLIVEQTYPHDPSWPDIDPAVDIWCPLWAFIDRKTVLDKVAHGDEVWSYKALVQRAPRYHPEYERVQGQDPPYWHIDRPPIVYRVPCWINRQYGVTGLLYWTTMTSVIEPWLNPAFAHPDHYNGGGYLFYPGAPCGIDGPVSCIRLKNLRDGMEDYEYFALLEQVSGNKAVKAVVDTVAPNWWDYCREPEKLMAARRVLAEQIVRASDK